MLKADQKGAQVEGRCDTNPARSGLHNVAIGLAESARRSPNAIAVVREREFTYMELVSLTSGLSSRLSALGIGRGDRVAIAARNTLEHVAAWYAVIGLGAIAVDMNLLLGDEEWHHILANCAPEAILSEEPYTSRLLPLADVHAQMVPIGEGRHGPDGWMPFDMAASDPALIAYTSGTTGLPKGVVHTHGALMAQLALLLAEVGYASSWVVYQSIPLFSLHGYLPQVAITIQVGGAVVLADKFDGAAFASASQRYPISYMTLSSPMVPQLIDQAAGGQLDLSHIKLISCGGAPLHPPIVDKFRNVTGVHLTQGYGMTELLGAFVMDLDGDAPSGASGRIYPRGIEALRILGEGDEPINHGEAGEIAIRAEFATERYWPNQWVELADGRWFRTGDVGRIDKDGYLYLLDRKKDVVFRGGFNIYSAEIERVLVSDDQVEEATVIGTADPLVGEVPIAYVVLARGAPDDTGSRLLADATRRLGRLKRPEAVHVVRYEDLPRNALGKVQKSSLRALAARNTGGLMPPLTSTALPAPHERES